MTQRSTPIGKLESLMGACGVRRLSARSATMSLRLLQPIPPVSDHTARVARAAFRARNPCLILRDRLGALFTDADFADFRHRRG